MGFLIDSTVFVESERKGMTAREAIAAMQQQFPQEEIAISVITLAELAHGAVRAKTPTRETERRLFIQELMASIPLMQVTPPVALRAGEIDGMNRSKGIHLALSDLLIGATALDRGYKVVTANVRHFRLIPGLEIIPF